MRSSFLYVLILMTTFTFVACDNDGGPDNIPALSNIALTANTTSFTIVRGSSVDIAMTGTADNGIAALAVSINGGASESITVNSGANSQDFTYSYDLPGSARLNSVVDLVFTLTDAENQTQDLIIAVSAGPSLPAAPATYTFERNGASSVSFSGQTDRPLTIGFSLF